MTDKMRLMHKVWYSDLTATQKAILTYLISKADGKGVAWPTVATLCQVAGIKHEKNFKGVAHYLDGLVTVTKVGRQNYYLLNTPALEGLSEAEVILKETPSRTDTPAVEGLNTPAPADNTPATEGSNTPAVEGTERTVDRTRERTEERTTPAAPVEDQEEEVRVMSSSDAGTLSCVEDAEPSLGSETPAAPVGESLDSLTLDSFEKEIVRRLRMDRKSDEYIYKMVMSERTDSW